MTGKHNLAMQRPQVSDIMAQLGVYGATIPLIIGTQLQPPLVIWMNGIHKTSGKKSSKKGQQMFQCQIDLLLAHNPVVATFRCWQNGPSVGLGTEQNKTVQSGGTTSFTISDPLFYVVYGVTATIPYSYSFNDYGSNAPSSGSGSYEIPLWNTAIQGPDPTNPSGYRWAPYTYYNLPGSATVSQMHVPGATAINIYYATLASSGWGAGQIPIAKVLNLAFESSLGDGAEYTSPNNYASQRIIYPMYAGAGSSTFDLGQGAAPQMKIETLGNCGLYPDGIGMNAVVHASGPNNSAADADFADMVELVLRQGLGQGALLSTGVGTATGQSITQTGCSSFNFPGMVQKKFWSPDLGGFGGSIQLDKPVTQGNILFAAVASTPPVNPFTIADLLAGGWTAVVNSGGAGFWYKTAGASGADTITFTNVPSGADVIVGEIAGPDTVDAAVLQQGAVLSLPTASVTTTQTVGQSEYLLAWVFPNTSGATGSGNYPFWRSCVPSTGQGGNHYAVGPHNSFIVQRVVNQPGKFMFTGDAATNSWTVVLLALKSAVAPSYPNPFADLIDEDTMNLWRAQCRANGLWGSLLMNSQRKAQDWLQEIYEAGIGVPVWSGSKLKSIPRSEVSAFGNGAVYTAPTASGPLVNLTVDDAVGEPGKSWISITRKAVTDRPDLQRLQFPDRSNQYRAGTISQPDQGSLTLQGLRYATPKKYDMIVHVNVAKPVLAVSVRRATQLVRTYKFTLQARYKLLEAMALVTLTDPVTGLNQQPVRLTSVEEDEKFNLACEAEDFIYGLHDPKPLPVIPTNTSVTAAPTQYVPANVNVPVFIEPPPAMTRAVGNQLKIAVSDSDPQYGGCQVYVSVDGGASYNPVTDVNGSSILLGNATTGTTTADWPQALDPDTTNDLPVDLTESLGNLPQYTTQQEDQALYPYYVAGTGIYPYELMSYAVATLTAANKYTLKATGGGSNHLKRSLFGTWVNTSTPNTGSDHPMGSRFAFADPAGVGVMTIDVPTSWVGQTLKFKFVQFNLFGSGYSTLSAATAYSYTVVGNQNGPGGGTGGSGGAGSSTYTVSPTNPLTQTSPTNIHMANVVAGWSPSGLNTFYAARNFTIVSPPAPTTYYVTVYDPNQTGDTGASATLTAFCANTQAGAHVGQAGYVYMGSIVATASGTASGGGSGGSNPTGATTVQIPIPSTTRGDFSIAHGLGKTPSDVDIKIQSDGLIRFQTSQLWDATNVYLNASDDGLTGTLVIEL